MTRTVERLDCPICDGSGVAFVSPQTGAEWTCRLCQGSGDLPCAGAEDGTPCDRPAVVKGFTVGEGYCAQHGEGL
jgi:DnaJ-class molecular chaperone